MVGNSTKDFKCKKSQLKASFIYFFVVKPNNKRAFKIEANIGIVKEIEDVSKR